MVNKTENSPPRQCDKLFRADGDDSLIELDFTYRYIPSNGAYRTSARLFRLSQLHWGNTYADKLYGAMCSDFEQIRYPAEDSNVDIYTAAMRTLISKTHPNNQVDPIFAYITGVVDTLRCRDILNYYQATMDFNYLPQVCSFIDLCLLFCDINRAQNIAQRASVTHDLLAIYKRSLTETGSYDSMSHLFHEYEQQLLNDDSSFYKSSSLHSTTCFMVPLLSMIESEQAKLPERKSVEALFRDCPHLKEFVLYNLMSDSWDSYVLYLIMSNGSKDKLGKLEEFSQLFKTRNPANEAVILNIRDIRSRLDDVHWCQEYCVRMNDNLYMYRMLVILVKRNHYKEASHAVRVTELNFLRQFARVVLIAIIGRGDPKLAKRCANEFFWFCSSLHILDRYFPDVHGLFFKEIFEIYADMSSIIIWVNSGNAVDVKVLDESIAHFNKNKPLESALLSLAEKYPKLFKSLECDFNKDDPHSQFMYCCQPFLQALYIFGSNVALAGAYHSGVVLNTALRGSKLSTLLILCADAMYCFFCPFRKTRLYDLMAGYDSDRARGISKKLAGTLSSVPHPSSNKSSLSQKVSHRVLEFLDFPSISSAQGEGTVPVPPPAKGLGISSQCDSKDPIVLSSLPTSSSNSQPSRLRNEEKPISQSSYMREGSTHMNSAPLPMKLMPRDENKSFPVSDGKENHRNNKVVRCRSSSAGKKMASEPRRQKLSSLSLAIEGLGHMHEHDNGFLCYTADSASSTISFTGNQRLQPNVANAKKRNRKNKKRHA